MAALGRRLQYSLIERMGNLYGVWKMLSPQVSIQVSRGKGLQFTWKSKSRWFVLSSLQSHGLHPARLLCPWNSPGKNTGVGCHFLLQEIFLIQGMNLGLLHCRQIHYRLSHQGSPFRFTPLLNWAKDESLWTKSFCPALSLFPLQSHYLQAWCPLLSFSPLSWIIN